MKFRCCILLAVFNVTTTDDGVAGSLRDAIIQANALPGPHEIILPAGTYSGSGQNAITVENDGGRNGARGPDLFNVDLRVAYAVPLLAASLTTVVVVAAAVFLPQAPGFVGTWQAGCVIALTLFGVSREAAVGYSLLTWVIQMSVNIGAASVFLAREHLSVGQLVRVAAEEAPSAPTER